jgi:hypothetical protein
VLRHGGDMKAVDGIEDMYRAERKKKMISHSTLYPEQRRVDLHSWVWVEESSSWWLSWCPARLGPVDEIPRTARVEVEARGLSVRRIVGRSDIL